MKSPRAAVIDLLMACCVGVASGLFGIGGGVLLVPLLVLVFGFEQHRAQGTSLVALVPPTGLLAFLNYARAGEVNWTVGLLIMPGVFFGAMAGTRLAQKLSAHGLRRAVAVAGVRHRSVGSVLGMAKMKSVASLLDCPAEPIRVSCISVMMVDIHCHILPGLDDGADTLETSIQMAEMAIADGVTHVVGTPHANSEYKFDPELIRQRRDELQAAVGDRLTLATGCDFHLSFENLQDIQKNPQKYTINQKNYLLVEFADFAIPPSMDDTHAPVAAHGLVSHHHASGAQRAAAHQARANVSLAASGRLRADHGAIHSGTFRDRERNAAPKQWLDDDRVHFVASDAHNLKGRPLQLRAAYDAVAERRGEAVAQALFHDNPLAAFEGRSLPYEPEQLDPAAKPMQYKRRKRFLFF